MDRKRIISYLLIANLTIILILMIGKLSIVLRAINVIFKVIIVPIIFGTFLFYILRPLNNIFRKKKLKSSTAATLTIIIFFFIASGILKYFSEYFIEQFFILKDLFIKILKERELQQEINRVVNENVFNVDYYSKFLGDLKTYIGVALISAKGIFNKGMQVFSDALLIVLILFYLLRDGEKLKDKIISLVPKKYENTLEEVLDESNTVLSSYILGQATVALSLSMMVYVGYKIIGMTSPLFLATITFILAFIPFIGFFISMIVPYIIAVTMGWTMVLKLTVLFIIAQTLKGRLVVPLIMGKVMKIHPITDIFLVVSAATLIGPVGAFVIIPIYTLLKVFYNHFRSYIDFKLLR
ncbi:AI-2E family transporter [Clostridium chauvoei]|uniref:Permease n=2 Tax=Clostridium chauvoei TaxID=46867 RepID=S6EU14_9CLOT|nr:AI-2E family transporter [Clostridium chauvoei]ATD53785.1 AI-2E family transporter [Clostridium chauvoei]ATD58407.1 AI-2E family transporter [Clostridium chauvoei]MBX7281739.1 AI-2E family transporter [Clostridium chauvoei]MBX7284288.1 AI-2E family transporter [Clostridium chauvoei]MBX7286783.1 AI-2E family transporter [Clostridium chauvoei]